MCQWIALIFLHRLVYPEKRNKRKCEEKKFEKLGVLIILSRENDYFFFEIFCNDDYVIFKHLCSIF
jgi:hypothetical protein